MTSITQELRDYIENQNAKTQAWLNEAEGRWASFIPTDEEYFVEMAEQGITTVAEFQLDEAARNWWDYHKSVTGVRPRWVDTTGWTLEDYEQAMDRLEEQARWEAEAEAEAERVENMTWQEHLAEADLSVEEPNNPFAILKEVV